MIKSIWEKIKLAFERKPIGEIYKVDINVPTLPPDVKFDDTTLSSSGVTKPKRTRKPKNESA